MSSVSSTEKENMEVEEEDSVADTEDEEDNDVDENDLSGAWDTEYAFFNLNIRVLIIQY